MVAVVKIVSRYRLRIETHSRNQTNKTKLALYKLLLSLYLNRLKQLYTSKKMEYFSYKGGHGICISRSLKEELDWAVDKWFQFISNVMLFKTVIPLIEIKPFPG